MGYTCCFCRKDGASVKLDEKVHKYFVICKECGARGSLCDSTSEAIEVWQNPCKSSDYENFTSMLQKSEFSNYFTEEQAMLEIDGENVETLDVIFINQANGTNVRGIFHKGTEDMLGIVLDHKCSCGG